MTFYGGLSAEHLKQFIERLERIEEEKSGLADDTKMVFAEAKSGGFDTKTIKEVLKHRKLDKNTIDEQEHLLGAYKRALGMLPELDKEGQLWKTLS